MEQIKSSSRCVPSLYFEPNLVLNTCSRLAVALRLVAALVTSPHLHIEPFAHQVHTAAQRLSRAPRARPRLRQIMPAVIMCIVCKALWGAKERRAALQPSARPLVRQNRNSNRKPVSLTCVALFVQVHPQKRSRVGRPHPQALRRRLPHAHPVTMHTLLHACSTRPRCPVPLSTMRLRKLVWSSFVSASDSFPAAFLHPLWCSECHLHHVAALNSHAAAAPHAAVSPRPPPLIYNSGRTRLAGPVFTVRLT